MWSKHKWYYPTVQISDGEDWLGMTHVLVKCEDFLPSTGFPSSGITSVCNSRRIFSQ